MDIMLGVKLGWTCCLESGSGGEDKASGLTLWTWFSLVHLRSGGSAHHPLCGERGGRVHLAWFFLDRRGPWLVHGPWTTSCGKPHPVLEKKRQPCVYPGPGLAAVVLGAQPPGEPEVEWV